MKFVSNKFFYKNHLLEFELRYENDLKNELQKLKKNDSLFYE